MSTRNRAIIHVLQVFWTVITLWYELFIFYHSAGYCSWPDQVSVQGQSHHLSHILVVADPQIIDHRSYPGRSSVLLYLSQLFVDLNLRKNWRAALQTQPDAVIFLGDMMDNGRADMPEDEYEQYYDRFKKIFRMPSEKLVYFLPGNHDTGLGTSSSFSPNARARYTSHFGQLNSQISIANHTLVLLDAPGLVEEDNKRADSGQSYHEWRPISGGPVEMLKSLIMERRTDPVILLTHIPLYRVGLDCGLLREKGTIRPGGGIGMGYQNTLGEDVTAFILHDLRPSVIFSGDDHDYCEYQHPTSIHGGANSIREVSVKSISMAMGIRRPGFQLLSLASHKHIQNPQIQTHADVPCFLPDQIEIYLSVYIPLLFVSLVIVLITNSRIRICPFGTPRRARRSSSPRSFEFKTRSESTKSEEEQSGNTSYLLPQPVSEMHRTHRGQRSRPSFFLFDSHHHVTTKPRTFSLFPSIIFSCFDSRQARKIRQSFAGESLRDIRDIAMFPLTVFLSISLYTFFN